PGPEEGGPRPLGSRAAGRGSGGDRPVRRLMGAATAPPLPCCAVTDRGLPARAARGLGRDPRLPCTGAGAPSPLRFGAAGRGSGSDRPVRRLIGTATAPPLPCCAVTDRRFFARAARGPGRRYAQRPQPAQARSHSSRTFVTPRNMKRRRPIACLLSACRRKTCGRRAGPNSAAGRRGRRRSAYEAPRAAVDGGTGLGGAESKRRRRPRLPAPPFRVTPL